MVIEITRVHRLLFAAPFLASLFFLCAAALRIIVPVAFLTVFTVLVLINSRFALECRRTVHEEAIYLEVAARSNANVDM